ncbi:MAG: type II toxin-antitoxin system RelE/ParE family toxin [Geobacter sp.]|nr:type II toxin-antitoxin system RelE/ParE family toxin [Geobacter sp.]
MNQPFKITRAALSDLRDISNYTFKTWGKEQEAAYIKGLFTFFERIARNDTQNRDLSMIVPVCFSCKISHHLIIFRWLDDGRPEIIRILHEKMDIPNRLLNRRH